LRLRSPHIRLYKYDIPGTPVTKRDKKYTKNHVGTGLWARDLLVYYPTGLLHDRHQTVTMRSKIKVPSPALARHLHRAHRDTATCRQRCVTLLPSSAATHCKILQRTATRRCRHACCVPAGAAHSSELQLAAMWRAHFTPSICVKPCAAQLSLCARSVCMVFIRFDCWHCRFVWAGQESRVSAEGD